ncbi:DUF4124 domain-containing protein [Vreelandella jeotgali]|uniref:DUF4124 domain-containing protein n=1 Tax=Vreelandella jeotgali TaxID=553386 RepID=UPI000477A0A1|nr:DUF4124 domain-containing protein [Halomonas jeotgali]
MTPQRLAGVGGVLLAAMVATPAAADSVYRVEDDAGNVTFTDDAASGGREMTLEPLQTITSSAAPSSKSSRSSDTAAPSSPFMPYDRFAIARPSGEARLPARPFAVNIDVSPALRDDHQARLVVDGSVSQSALHSEAFWVPRLAPGRHRLKAELLDAAGKVRHRTPVVEVRVVDSDRASSGG